MGSRERLVHRASVRKIIRVVFPAIPWNAVLFGKPSVQSANPCTFTSSELLHRVMRNIFPRKSHGVHFPRDRKPFALVGDKLCLRHNQARRMGERLAVRIVANAALAHPYHARPRIAKQLNRPMGDIRPWTKHKNAKGCRGNICRPSRVGNTYRTILPVDKATFHIQERHPFLHRRKGMQIWLSYPGNRCHLNHAPNGTRVSNPHPNAFPCPMPFTKA